MAKKANNPYDFSNLFNQFDPNKIFSQFQDAFKNFDYPQFDSSGLLETQRKNLESLQKANQSALEGTQKLFERQAELLQEAMKEAGAALSAMADDIDPQSVAQKQTELVSTAFEKAITNSKEISKLIQDTQEQVSATVNQRISEGLDEIKAAIGDAAKK